MDVITKRFSKSMLCSFLLHALAFASLAFGSQTTRKSQGYTQVITLNESKGTALTPKVAAQVKTSLPIQQKTVAPSTEGNVAVAAEKTAEQTTTAATDGGDANAQAEQQQASTGSIGEDANSLLVNYQQTLFWAIEQRKYYPLIAKRAHLQGTVMIELLLNDEGEVLHAEITRSSGHAILDQAALKLIKDHDRFPAPPRGIKSTPWRFEIPLTYTLS